MCCSIKAFNTVWLDIKVFKSDARFNFSFYLFNTLIVHKAQKHSKYRIKTKQKLTRALNNDKQIRWYKIHSQCGNNSWHINCHACRTSKISDIVSSINLDIVWTWCGLYAIVRHKTMFNLRTFFNRRFLSEELGLRWISHLNTDEQLWKVEYLVAIFCYGRPEVCLRLFLRENS